MAWFKRNRPLRRSGDGFTTEDRYAIHLILVEVHSMTDIVTRLKADVAAQTSLIASCTTLLQGLAQRIRDANANADEDELDAIADDIESNTTALSGAVTQNTPADTSAGQQSAPTVPTPQQPAPDSTPLSQQPTGDFAGTVGAPPVSDPSSVIGEGGEVVQPTDQTNDQSGSQQ